MESVTAASPAMAAPCITGVGLVTPLGDTPGQTWEALLAGRRWLEESLDAAKTGDGVVLVAADADGSAGAISVRSSTHFTGERDGYIGVLVVADRVSRHGIGRALIAAADAWARDRGLRNLTLHTGAFNTNARGFYAALGFVEEEVRLTRPVADLFAEPGR